MHRFLYFFLVFSLLFAALFIGLNTVKAQTADSYSLQLQGFVWTHPKLTALIVTADNEPWWDPYYVNITLRAIGQWNDAAKDFASNYTDFSYLSDLSIEPTSSNEPLPGFDIYINWTQSPLSNISDEVGLSQIVANSEGAIVNCSVNLAVHTHHGEALNEGDMQNIALHEFGHSLGLGHTNYTGDLMYALYNMGNPSESVSTLDAYGVATLFGWMVNSSKIYPISSWLTKNYVVLPADTYRDLPVSPQNAPPQTLTNNPVVQTLIFILEILIHPEIFAVVVIVIIIFVIVALVPSKKKRKRG